MKQLTKHQRNEIQILREKGYSLREIWSAIGKHYSTVSKELKRNKVKWKYLAEKANFKAYQRRQKRKVQMKKIRHNDKLENYIREKLTERRTPQLIAWVRNKSHPEQEISFKSIYKYIYSRFWEWLWECLYSKRRRPKKRKWNSSRRQLIPHRTWIDARPLAIWLLQEFGHYEADLIVWPRWGSKDVLLTLTEKKTRFKLAYKLSNRSPIEVQKKLQSVIKRFGIQSITFDNWIEFMYHYKLGISTYFCHPYHSREKGQIEYTNKLYRIFIPKWSDLSNFTQQDIDLITSNLNKRPMICLDYETPLSIFSSYFLSGVAITPTM